VGESPADTTTTTADIADGVDLLGMPPDEVAWYAENRGVSIEAAVRMLLAEAELSSLADHARHEPWYAGFKVVTSGETVSGVLAVTDDPDLEIPEGMIVEVIRVRLSESDYLMFQDSMKQLLKDRIAGLVGVTYEPFEDVVLVWLSADSEPTSSNEANAIEEWTRGELDQRFLGVRIRIVIAPEVELAG
jgi:hypothetical protein